MSKKASNTVSTPNKNALVLSIDKVHADRIFSGEKRYELRKKLPAGFGNVYLYENGNAGIVGAFKVAEVIHSPVAELWRTVGEAATSKKRFFEYFNGAKTGYAIRVKQPIRFSPPLEVAELKKRVPIFSAPQSYLLLKPGERLLSLLERRRKQSQASSTVVLRPIRADEEKDFIKWVTREIRSRYDGITPGFAKSLLDTNRLGRDPRGILTMSKEVLTICDRAGLVLGYTTLTYKVGGCVKTGPTIIFPKHRRKGIGNRTRELIVDWVIERGARKLYCTCPDDDEVVFRYLLKAGFKVEAHLDSQYHTKHGEFVLGRFVNGPDFPANELPELTGSRCSVVPLNPDSIPTKYKQLLELVRRMLPTLTSEQLKAIVERAAGEIGDQIEQKPLRIWFMKRGDEYGGVLFLIPKRGGSVKAVFVTDTSNQMTLSLAVETAEQACRDFEGRKLYFLVRVVDYHIARLLRSLGYENEGTLREPYAKGDDVLVLTKKFAVIPSDTSLQKPTQTGAKIASD